ncbi:Apolipoprotein D [Frankliniella fusca]|uniref:Apolipoprotein D n=1 Tax=Frankliniella fusca TaxID=407009 RepID=A0AAE1GYJ3_9NEOP|nr:Apolipoprotein D [Frankliniella fusca]
MSRTLFALCVLALVAHSQAALSFGKCPTDIPAVKYLMSSRFFGSWKQYETTSQLWRSEGKCPTLSYSQEDYGRIHLQNTMTMFGKTVIQDGYAAHVGDNISGRLNVIYDVPMFGYVNASHIVVDTDFGSFAVVYSCAPIGAMKAEFGYILRRNMNPWFNVEEKIDAAVAKTGFSRDAFKKNC